MSPGEARAPGRAPRWAGRRDGRSPASSRRGALLGLGLSPFLLAAQCGPTTEEAGAVVLLIAPLVLLATALVLWGLTALWAPVLPGLAVRWRPLGHGLLVWTAVTLVVALPLSNKGGVVDWAGIAFATYGAASLAWTLLLWRLWIHGGPADAFHRPALIVHAIVTLPALPMALSGATAEPFAGPAMLPTTFWLYTGWLGIPAGVILLALLIEGGVRRARR